MLEYKRKQLLSAIGGLDCASKRRLHHYRSHLASDRDPKIFDDRMRDMLVQLAIRPEVIQDTVRYLDSIGFNQSKYEFDKIKQQLSKFAEPNHKYYGWHKHFKGAKEAFIKEVSSWRCDVLQYNSYNIASYIPKLSTHAGFSYVQTGKRRKGDYVDGMFSSYFSEEHSALEKGSFFKPILIGSRTQASGAFDSETGERTGTFKAKTRLVSMIDINVIMAERKFQYPIQNWLSHSSWYAGGKNDIDISGKLQWCKHALGNWISIDYSSYDQSISDWLIHEAFDVIKAMFKPMKEKDQKLFDVIKHDFISKVFIAEEGHLVFSDKGVPSGSMFTQIIDSICNRLMIDTYLNSLGIKERHMLIMGDDNIIFTRQKIDLHHLSSYLQYNFGITCNPDKCSKGTEFMYPHFLSRTWSPKIFRDPSVLISKLCYPEHYREYDSLGESPFTVIMQYYDNFPAGMELLLDKKKLAREREVRGQSRNEESYKLMSGLTRYRLMFDRRLSNY